ncbi:MAG TPA: hypothetical protein ENG63_02910 [Candidatus Desulfofervidus auxilii]|uniref:Uncharacterized protein n=1 Tax=Desulfofervidus auxilii TaxID=1621989 RepID=A0A7C0Y3U2_DESA2|nr:hypothetical protein [Candidatus Desulfofervidus auxilii]
MKRICLKPFEYRHIHCDYRRVVVNGTALCICNNERCKECMERYSKPVDEIDPQLLELLQKINLKGLEK